MSHLLLFNFIDFLWLIVSTFFANILTGMISFIRFSIRGNKKELT